MDARCYEEFTGLTVEHVKAWLERNGWEFGRYLGGNKGMVSPCREFSVACYWLNPENLHTAVEHIAECLSLGINDLLRTMKSLPLPVEKAA